MCLLKCLRWFFSFHFRLWLRKWKYSRKRKLIFLHHSNFFYFIFAKQTVHFLLSNLYWRYGVPLSVLCSVCFFVCLLFFFFSTIFSLSFFLSFFLLSFLDSGKLYAKKIYANYQSFVKVLCVSKKWGHYKCVNIDMNFEIVF